MVKLIINLFKDTGKWYDSGEVTICECMLWDPEFKQQLVNNQKIVVDGALNNFFVIVTHSKEFDESNERGFYQIMYRPGSFEGV